MKLIQGGGQTRPRTDDLKALSWQGHLIVLHYRGALHSDELDVRVEGLKSMVTCEEVEPGLWTIHVRPRAREFPMPTRRGIEMLLIGFWADSRTARARRTA